MNNETVGFQGGRVNVFRADVAGVQSSKYLDAEVVAAYEFKADEVDTTLNVASVASVTRFAGNGNRTGRVHNKWDR